MTTDWVGESGAMSRRDGRRKFTALYLAYCKAHGFDGDPGGMLAHDVEEWPGGKMTGYVLWVARKRREFADEHGISGSDYATFIMLGVEGDWLTWMLGL